MTGDNEQALKEYAERIADLVDDAMQSQEETKELPAGLKYDGVSVVDPDAPEEPEVIEPEVIPPGKE